MPIILFATISLHVLVWTLTSFPAAAREDGEPTPELINEIDSQLDKYMTKYNTDDPKAFTASYAEHVNDSTYTVLNKIKHGRYVSRTIKSRSPVQENGLHDEWVYDAVFEKNNHAKITVSPKKESGGWTFGVIWLNFEDRNAAPADNKPEATPVIEMKLPKDGWEKSNFQSARVGDFAEYEFPSTPGMKLRQEIVETGDHSISLLTTTTFNGSKSLRKSKMIYSEPEMNSQMSKADLKSIEDKVTVDKGTFTATRYESYKNDKLTGKSWVSKDVPIYGIVRNEGADGKATQVLVDYGRGK